MSLQSLKTSLLRSTRSLTQTRSSQSTQLPRSSFIHPISRRSQHTLSATPEQFKEAIKSEQTTLVDFFAEWCGPCKHLTPVLKQVIPSDSKDVHCKSKLALPAHVTSLHIRLTNPSSLTGSFPMLTLSAPNFLTNNHPVVTIDTDDHYELASEYKISALPTVIAFRNGEPIGKFIGGRNQSGVEAFLEEVQA
ncbi:BQ2448_4103 [Microbotryum intermedium]|uniref:BQ2448_4103 protein n=1 Tax=Microbotryum intermedium TaxID=269621 RepID=A0A238FNB3_9BASI|nr:BQ2448_4103 [Microbotryum intermedium]